MRYFETRPLARAGVAVLLAAVIVLAAIRFVFPQFALSMAVDLQRSHAGLEKHELKLPDGLVMSYLEGGNGPPLVLLHGFGANKDNFDAVAPFLTPQYRVIVPDLLGFGESSKPADADYAPAAQVEHVRALLKAIGVQGADVGGSSMGGQIALSWAAAYPQEVRSLWLLDPAGIWSAPMGEAERIVRQTGRNPLTVSNADELEQLLGFVMTKPPRIPHFLLAVMAEERARNRVLEERIVRRLRDDSLEPRITGLKVSTLVVFGEQDRVINPATAEILKRLLPRAHVVLMPGIGHLPALEAPAAAASDYIRFRDSM